MAYGIEQRVIIFFGPPGSGKGTQAAMVAAQFSIPSISTGEMLRHECDSGSPLGISVKSILASGNLVSDEIMNEVVRNRIGQADCARGFILDGYPRTLLQARFFDKLLHDAGLPEPLILHLTIDAGEVLARLTHRLQCRLCGKIFHVDGDPDAEEFRCDRDGSKLVHRPDDNPKSILERIHVYEKAAAEVLEYYRTEHDYHRIPAARKPNEVFATLISIIQGALPVPRKTVSGAFSPPPVSNATSSRPTMSQ